MWRGKVSVSHAWDLIQELPESSRYVAAVRGGDEFLGWTYERTILTYQANLMRLQLWVSSNFGAEKPSKQPDLIPIPGSGSDSKPKENRLRNLLAQKRAELEAAQVNTEAPQG